MNREAALAESERAQTRLGLRKFDRVLIESNETPARLDERQNFAGVPAVTERAINGNFAGFRIENLKNFRDHDRSVHSRRRFSGCENPCDRVGVFLGIALLIFLLETTRIFSRITRTTT